MSPGLRHAIVAKLEKDRVAREVADAEQLSMATIRKSDASLALRNKLEREGLPELWQFVGMPRMGTELSSAVVFQVHHENLPDGMTITVIDRRTPCEEPDNIGGDDGWLIYSRVPDRTHGFMWATRHRESVAEHLDDIWIEAEDDCETVIGNGE
jgi:hypothetical protein